MNTLVFGAGKGKIPLFLSIPSSAKAKVLPFPQNNFQFYSSGAMPFDYPTD